MPLTTIRRVDILPFEVDLDAPFGIAGGALARACNVRVDIELASGVIGYGEAAPFPAVTGETQQSTLAQLRNASAHLIGADAARYRPLLLAIRAHIGLGSALAAIEAATLDALTRHRSTPLWQFFGGATSSLSTDMTVTTGSVTEARAAAAAIVARGIDLIKVKVGGNDPSDDVARVMAIHEASGGKPLLLDGNCALDADAAIAMVRAVRELGATVALFEQPVQKHDLAGLGVVQQRGEVLVAADEAVQTARDALAIARLGCAGVINIKLMKAGLLEALDIAAVARAAGIELMIGAMVETRLGTATSACFAAGLGGFRFVDLDTPWFLRADPFSGGYTEAGATLDVGGIKAGHGVGPRADA